MRIALPVVLLASLTASAIALQQPASKPATPAAAPAAPAAKPAASVANLAFLAGTWTGTMGEDAVEETWSAPSGDSIIGMFRWQTGAARTTTMWELLAITNSDAGPTLRLRHFDKDFNPWKSEAEGIASMPATTVEPTRVVFTAAGEVGGLSSVEYHCPTSDTLKIVVSFKDAKRPALKFELKRASK